MNHDDDNEPVIPRIFIPPQRTTDIPPPPIVRQREPGDS